MTSGVPVHPPLYLSVHTCRRGGDDRSMCVHVFNKVLGHSLQLLHFPHIQRNTPTRDRNWARGWRLFVHIQKAMNTNSKHTLFTWLLPTWPIEHFLTKQFIFKTQDIFLFPDEVTHRYSFRSYTAKTMQSESPCKLIKSTTYRRCRGAFHWLAKRGGGGRHSLGLRRRHSSSSILVCIHLTGKGRTLYMIGGRGSSHIAWWRRRCRGSCRRQRERADGGWRGRFRCNWCSGLVQVLVQFLCQRGRRCCCSSSKSGLGSHSRALRKGLSGRAWCRVVVIGLSVCSGFEFFCPGCWWWAVTHLGGWQEGQCWFRSGRRRRWRLGCWCCRVLAW